MYNFYLFINNLFLCLYLNIYIYRQHMVLQGFPSGSHSKESACTTRDQCSTPGSGRSAGEGNGNLLQYSCLENPMDSRAWWATVHGVQRVRHNWATSLSLFQQLNVFTLSWDLHCLKQKVRTTYLILSSWLQSFPASESFPVSQIFGSGGQSIGVTASASVLPKNIQDWFPLGLTDWISLLYKGLSRVFSNTTVQKHQFFSTQLSFFILFYF